MNKNCTVSYSDIEHITAVADVLRTAYYKIIDLSDIADGVEVYRHNMDIAKSLRLMETESLEYAGKIITDYIKSNKRNGVEA